eukprot:GILK01007576.1.p1 GENE.GILK01007576.1~~GILK01007576.1.p1  ORF type:complete len:476 (-),score=56.38 GILK01007576.1:150-1526(-)
MEKSIVLALVLASLLYAYRLAGFLNRTVDTPYMDEPFHVGQARHYCAHEFSQWDPKITTFPGLYLVSLLLKSAVGLFGSLDACNLAALRAVNTYLFGPGSFFIMYDIVRVRHNPDSTVSLMYAVLLGLFPVHFFFHFLYYTDSGSTFFVLLMYLLTLKQAHKAAALAGIAAILFRQTNAIWLAFCVVEGSLRAVGMPQSRSIRELWLSFKVLFSQIPVLLTVFWPHISVLLSFAAFVVFNRGIVIGDKANHQPVAHIPQLFYFSLFSCVGLGLSTASPSRIYEFIKLPLCSLRNLILTVLATALVLLAIHKFSYAHPFLLADNRHYPFYVWKNIMRRHPIVPYALAPVYLFSMWSINRSLAEKTSLLWRIAFFACVAIVLVPAHLLEFRYFIVPFLLLHLNVGPSCFLLSGQPPLASRSLLNYGIHLLGFIAVNVATIFLFLFKPFIGPDGNTARFMW